MWFERPVLPSLAWGEEITLHELAALKHATKHAVANVAAHSVFAVYFTANARFTVPIGKGNLNRTNVSKSRRFRVKKITRYRRLYLGNLATREGDGFAILDLGKCRSIASRQNECRDNDSIFQHDNSIGNKDPQTIANMNMKKQPKFWLGKFGRQLKESGDVV